MLDPSTTKASLFRYIEGRTGPPKGPRTIDIDILLYGASRIHSSRLEIPHPRMQDRRFVLAPLVELAPDLRHPVSGATMRDLLASLEGQKVRKVESSIVSAGKKTGSE